MALVLAYEVDGELWPVSVQVRLKASPCWHDVEPQEGGDSSIEWSRQPCDCWPASDWPAADSLPPGGLPVRLLKNVKIRDLITSYERAVANLAAAAGTLDHPRPEVARHFRAIADAAERPKSQRGRPRTALAVQLRRLELLDAAYRAGLTQRAAARRQHIGETALRATLKWARRQDPPLWTDPGQGRRGQLTTHGRSMISASVPQAKRVPRQRKQPEGSTS